MAKDEVVVVMGGPSPEAEVSERSGRCVARALEERGVPVRLLRLTERMRFADGGRELTLAEAAELFARCRAVFPLVHGPVGEDGTLQGFLEFHGAGYVGSDVVGSALAMDKRASRALALRLGLQVPEGWEFPPRLDPDDLRRRVDEIADGGGEWFVKPARLGSSVGVRMATTPGELREAVREAAAAGGGVVVERRVEGREMTVGVLEVGDGPVALPPVLIEPPRGTFFSYESKYDGSTVETCPAGVSEEITARLKEAALRVHVGFGLRDLSRSDFIVGADGEPRFLEVNTLPGLTEQSLFPKAVRAFGKTLPDVAVALVVQAEGRARRP